jgi:hypothetical protein
MEGRRGCGEGGQENENKGKADRTVERFDSKMEKKKVV